MVFFVLWRGVAACARVLFILCCLSFVAAADELPLRVVTTTSHIAEMVQAIGGNRVTVSHLLGESVDPHTYKLTRSDMVHLLRADTIFYNGLHLEGKMTEALTRLEKSGRPVFTISDFLNPSRLVHPSGTSTADPHIWMDVALWASASDGVQKSLCSLLPVHCQEFATRASAYQEKLLKLDHRVRAVLATIPVSSRVLVTAHDAFHYFGRAYTLKVEGVQGISTDSEAGLQRIENLVKFLAERKIPAVFVETSISPRTVQALVEGARALGHPLTIGGFLYSDALGAPGTPAGTYPGMIIHNVTTITQALGGRVSVSDFSLREKTP